MPGAVLPAAMHVLLHHTAAEAQAREPPPLAHTMTADDVTLELGGFQFGGGTGRKRSCAFRISTPPRLHSTPACCATPPHNLSY